MLIPQGHLLRKINDLIDFQFVLDELKSKYCQDNGRTAENPVRMFKYLLLKTIYTLSDVDVVEHSRYDLSYKYFLGMMPEDNVIDPSTDGVSGKRSVQVFSEGALQDRSQKCGIEECPWVWQSAVVRLKQYANARCNCNLCGKSQEDTENNGIK